MALPIDAVFGYPGWLFKRIGHPVTWIGALIAALDRILNRDDMSRASRQLAGVAALAVLVGIPLSLAIAANTVIATFPGGFFLEALIASSFIASRSLWDHVRDVAMSLEQGGLEAGRASVSKIVGRDPNSLDEAGVSRAAIESLAENASDGVVAPVFWFAMLGLPGMVAYKAINTVDSMIGHRTPRHEAFGWAAARLDDLVNLPASRLTAALFAAAAFFMRGASCWSAFGAVAKDARRHRSPNAGWPESAMAGALGLKLAGPRSYGGVQVEDAYMGNGRLEAGPPDIRRALHLASVAWCAMASVIALLALASG